MVISEVSSTVSDKFVNISNSNPMENLKASSSSLNSTLMDVDLKKVEEPEPTSTLIGAGANLIKAILGVGMMNLPVAIKTFGYVPGIILLSLAAIASCFGLHLYCVCAAVIGRTSSFSGIAKITYPRASIILDIVIMLKCVGVALSYLIIIGQVMVSFMTPYIEDTTSYWLDNRVWIGLFMIFILPLSFFRQMNHLKYTSMLGLLSDVYLVLLTFVYCLIPSKPHAPQHTLTAFVPISFESLSSFGTFIFAFTCHQIIIPLHNQTIKNSPRHLLILVSTCITIALVVYLIFGVSSYISYADQLSSSTTIFNLMPNDNYMQMARILFAALVGFSYPLQVVPYRLSMEKMLSYLPAKVRTKHDFLLQTSNTLSIIVITFGLSMFLSSPGKVFNLVGNMTSSIICYLMPTAFYLKLTEGKEWTVKRIACVLLLILGLISFSLCSASSIYAFFK